MRTLFSSTLLVVWSLAGAADAAAQGAGDGRTNNIVLAGYGSVGYSATLDDDFANDFSAAFAPIFLYEVGSNFLFSAELEFGLSGTQTETSLEYAQIDYFGFENVVLTAGKFLLPFGLFGERYHPSWINKLPTAPLIYGHSHGGVAEGSLLPVLSDAGALLKWNAGLSESSFLDISVWVSQGPRIAAEEEEDEHDEEDAASLQLRRSIEDPDGFHIPDIGFGVAFADNNSNKMVGGRAGVVTPVAEVYASGLTARYDDESDLTFKAVALSVVTRPGGWEFQGEAAFTWQEFGAVTERETLETPAFYVQSSRRMNRWEPVVRWSRHVEGEVDGVTARTGHDEVSLGMVYWLDTTIPLKFAYQLDPDNTDRITLQWGFGF